MNDNATRGLRTIANSMVRFQKKGECPVGRLQVKGTCWFQSVINGWILSTPSREIMKRKLAAFKQSNEMKKYTDIQACPMRGKLPVYFWSYVEYMIDAIEGKSKNNRNFNVQVMKNKQFSTDDLIQNIYKINKNKTEGGTIKNVYMFLDLMFPGNWSDDKPEYDIYIKNFEDNETIVTPPGYKLLHAWITSTNISIGHAITGFMCNKTPRVFDSNCPDVLPYNWVKDPDVLKLHFKQIYNLTNKLNRYCIFVKSKPSPLLYANPEYLKNVLNKNKIQRGLYTNKQLYSYAQRSKNFNENLGRYYSKDQLKNFILKMPANKLINSHILYLSDPIMTLRNSNKNVNAKLNSLVNGMNYHTLVKSGILKTYPTNKLKKITNLNTNNRINLYAQFIRKRNAKPKVVNTIPAPAPAKKGILGRIKNARIKHVRSRLNQANKLVKESQNSGMNKTFPRLYKGLVSKRNKLESELKKAQEPQVRLANRVKKFFGRSK